MADEPVEDPAQRRLQLEAPTDEGPVYFVPVSWQQDAVTSAILTSGTVAIVVALGWALDHWILARFLDRISLWIIRLILGVSFVVPMGAAILMDQARFVLRTFRDLKADWSEE